MSKEDLIGRMFREENKVRTRAEKILSDHMSDLTEEHIEVIPHLKGWIIDAMMSFVEIKVKEDENRRNIKLR